MIWWKKFLLGSLGGFCLVLVRLLVDGFFESEPVNRFGLFCAAACTVIIAGIWTLTEHEKRAGQLIKFGFGAPSILLLLVSQSGNPNHKKSPPVVSPEEIRSIDEQSSFFQGWLLPAAHADPPLANKTNDVQTVTLDSLKGGFDTGTRAFLGLPYDKATYAYVVGKTGDRMKAIELSKKLSKVISGGRLPNFRVLKLGKEETYLVIAGSVSDYADTKNLAERIQKSSFSEAANSGNRSAAFGDLNLVFQGGIVDLQKLASKP